MTADITKIREKIAKLLAMAQDTSSPNEAAIAAERARKMMDKYQLSELDITPAEDIKCGSVVVTKDYKYTPYWLNIMSVAVARYNDCHSALDYGKKDGYKHIVFHGLVDDVALAKDMMAYLEKAGVEQCKRYMASIGHGSYYVAKIGDAFKKGFAQAICTRLSQLSEDRKELTSAAGTSLAIVKTDIVEQYMGYSPRYSSAKAKTRDASAMRAGQQAGLAQSLHNQMD